MIAGAGLPMGKMVAATSSPKPRAEEREATVPTSPGAGTERPAAQEAHPSHPAEGETQEGNGRDAPPAERGRRDTSRAAGPRRLAHATRQPRRGSDDGDAPPDGAFARLLEPATEDKAPAGKSPAPTPQQEAAPDQRTGTLPDQLLGLLAALVPGANAGTATTPAGTQPAALATGAAPTAALPASTGVASDMPSPQASAAVAPSAQPATTAHDKAAAGGGDAALAALLPALQDKAGAGAPAAPHATEPGSAPPTAPHAGGVTDATAAPTFEALLHVPSGAPAPLATGPRVLPGAPAPLAQPADPRNGYGDEFGGNVVWMAEQRLGHAQLHVSPDHLGPIEVRLQLDGSQVQASFLSAQPDVRHALEASLPRLRELLGQHGLQLAQADVGQRQQDPRGLPAQRRAADGRDPVDEALAPALPTRVRVVRGLLDEYA